MNYVRADEGADRIRAAYGSNYERLSELKRKYDPNNLFRLKRKHYTGAVTGRLRGQWPRGGPGAPGTSAAPPARKPGRTPRGRSGLWP